MKLDLKVVVLLKYVLQKRKRKKLLKMPLKILQQARSIPFQVCLVNFKLLYA